MDCSTRSPTLAIYYPCRPHAAACTSAAGYTFHPGKLSPGGELGDQHIGMSASQLAAMCNDQLACKGFTSSGWLKSSIKLPSLWVDFAGGAQAGPCDGMFVKSDASFEGGWT